MLLSIKGWGGYAMDLRQLNYITVIAEELNLTRAAERLFVSQSTLSLYLSRLEKELGIRLFSRKNNRLVITAKGELYVETARKMLDMQKELYEQLHINQHEMPLNLGISSLFMLKIFAEVFPRFKPLAPHFNVNVTEGRATALLRRLSEGSLDVAIVGRDKIIQDENYQIQVLRREEMFLVLPPSHPHAYAASSDYSDPPTADMSLFCNENFTLSPHDTCDYQIAQRLFHDHHMNANVICELNNTLSLCQMVMDGLCLSVIPAYCIPRNMGLLVCRPPQPYYRYLLCFQHKGQKMSKEGIALLGMLIDTYNHYYE